MVFNGKEGLECEVHIDGIRLEDVLEFKYLECFLGKSGTYGAKCSRKVASGRRVTGAIRSLVMLGICIWSVLESCMKHCLYLECGVVLHEDLVLLVVM